MTNEELDVQNLCQRASDFTRIVLAAPGRVAARHTVGGQVVRPDQAVPAGCGQADGLPAPRLVTAVRSLHKVGGGSGRSTPW
jgi:hypothetical protein